MDAIASWQMRKMLKSHISSNSSYSNHRRRPRAVAQRNLRRGHVGHLSGLGQIVAASGERDHTCHERG